MVNKILSGTRYLLAIAVVVSLLAAITLLIIAGAETVQIIIKAFSTRLDAKAEKLMAVTFIEVIDILLLGTVFYITSLGLYELFIDENLRTPSWLHITDLDDLKSKLLSVIVVMLSVTFLAQVVNWDGERNLLFMGIAIAAVILAITFFIFWRNNKE
ncbi:MAG: hypothetical protein C3F13_13995 [Anaerolineales bacterium]|nr:YqhA family protein [Anaerolineae bacterium]PWB51543.1 MAG: hypothetical protein C3F13_13995 [Anaerolineales bacterium]